MTVQQIASSLGLSIVAGANGLGQSVVGGYAADLLSCVMAAASERGAWVTLQAHPNVVAVADLKDLACVIITEGRKPDEETTARANEKGIPLLLSDDDTYTVVGRLVGLGI